MCAQSSAIMHFCGPFSAIHGVVREGVIAENVPPISAKFQQLSAEFPHPFLTCFPNFRELSGEFPQASRKKPFANRYNDPVSELLTFKFWGPLLG